MCDFDITNFREKSTTTSKKSDSGKEGNSFAFYLQNLKKGLADSESESDDDDNSSTKKKKNKKNDPKTKRTWTEFNKDDTTSPPPTIRTPTTPTTPTAPSSESSIDKSSPVDTEELTFNQVDIKGSAGRHQQQQQQQQQQQPVQTAHHLPLIALVDDDSTTAKRNIVDIGDLTTGLPKRQRKVRPAYKASLDIDDLDPELASLFTQETECSSASDTQKSEITPEKVKIKIQFVSLLESTDPNIQSFLDSLSKPVKIIMLNNSPFQTMMEEYCKKKMLNMKEMVLVYENGPVVLRATPSSLSMSTDSTNKMEVYKRSDFEKKCATEQEFRAARLAQMTEPSLDDKDDQDGDDDGYNSQDYEEPPKLGALHIKLRGKDNNDVLLRVKPTTKIETIVKEYIRQKELDPGLLDQIQLSFEGETLELSMTIADTDLEDEDMVSVIIH